MVSNILASLLILFFLQFVWQLLKSFEPCIYSILTYLQVPPRTKAVLQQKPDEKVALRLADVEIQLRHQEIQIADVQRQTSKKCLIFKVSNMLEHMMRKFNQ